MKKTPTPKFNHVYQNMNPNLNGTNINIQVIINFHKVTHKILAEIYFI